MALFVEFPQPFVRKFETISIKCWVKETSRPSQSPYSSNVVILHKKDGTIHLCIHFHKYNVCTIKGVYEITRIEDSLHLLERLEVFHKARFKSGLLAGGIKGGYAKTAFQVGNLEFYECNHMPFGLCSASVTFHRFLERAMAVLYSLTS